MKSGPVWLDARITPEVFREFAFFDTFRRQKRWKGPALFALIMGGFAGVCFALRGSREQAALIGAVLLVVGLGLPEVFPEGAAMGVWASRITSRHSGWAGQRIPTVSSPAVTAAGTILVPSPAFLQGSIMVSGPGQNALASRSASSGTSRATAESCEYSAICTISGLSEGRPFAS